MNQSGSHLIQLLLAIAIMGSSGVLARSVGISPEMAIWVRCVLASMALYLVLRVMKLPVWIGKGKAFWVVLASTVLFGVHWVTYFYALHYSTVAIGMLSLFTYPVFTALLEPIIVKTKIKAIDLGLAVLAFTGVFFLVPGLDLNNQVTQGILFGLLSAIAYSFRNLLLKLNAGQHSGITLMFMQVLGLSVLLSPVFFTSDIEVHSSAILKDWQPLLILGLFTTALGHTLFVVSFRHFSITAISILSTLTPLIGIVLGFLFLGEIPEGNVWLGGALISISVVVESLKTAKSYSRDRQQKVQE